MMYTEADAKPRPRVNPVSNAASYIEKRQNGNQVRGMRCHTGGGGARWTRPEVRPWRRRWVCPTLGASRNAW